MKKIQIDWEMYESGERADREFAEKFRQQQLALFLQEREKERSQSNVNGAPDAGRGMTAANVRTH